MLILLVGGGRGGGGLYRKSPHARLRGLHNVLSCRATTVTGSRTRNIWTPVSTHKLLDTTSAKAGFPELLLQAYEPEP